MPNYESTSYHVEQDFDPEKSVAYSTFTDRDSVKSGDTPVADDDFVLRVWHTTCLPDGQPVNVQVLHTADDVKGLQSFLNDNFGRAKGTSQANGGLSEKTLQTQRDEDDALYFRSGWVSAIREILLITEAQGHAEALRWAREQEPGAGENLPGAPAGSLDYFESAPPVAPVVTQSSDGYVQAAQSAGVTLIGAAQSAGYDVPSVQRCAHISNGVQCGYAEHDSSYPHSFQAPAWNGYQTNASTPPNEDGAATPPATPTTTAASTAGDQAAESATGARTPAAAPSSAPAEPPKRTRRKKEEKAYDDALDAYTANQGNETWGALSVAYEALKNRLPDNARIAAGNAIGLGGPSEMGNPPPEPYNPPVAEAPAVVGFAPEPGGQPVAPWMEAPVLPQTETLLPAPNYVQQGQHPMNQQFAQTVAQLPGEHVQDTVYMTAEEAQASKAFPCVAHHSDGRQCVRPFGHEIQTATNPEPKPHMYGTDVTTLQAPNPAQFAPQQPLPAAPPVQPPAGFAVTQPVSTPVGSQLPYAVPPTPEQPNIPPAAPVWSQ